MIEDSHFNRLSRGGGELRLTSTKKHFVREVHARAACLYKVGGVKLQPTSSDREMTGSS